MITRRRSRHKPISNYSKVENANYNDDIKYFIEKMKNKNGSVFSDSNQNNPSKLDNMPEVFQNYKEFLSEYVKFTLSNITESYNRIVNEWLVNNPILIDKIKFVDSGKLEGVISRNIIEYTENKLRPGIINSVINRHFTDDEASRIWVNMETYIPPALAFLGPPGTAKTNAITSALATLAKGGENRIVWDWLRYDITTHEVTTAPLVLPVASDVVSDNPLTTVALMRATGNKEIDIALTENIQTKTLSKAIATFAYILKGGHENKRIELRPEVQQQIDNNVVLNSLKLETWEFVTTDKIDNNNIEEVIGTLTNAFSTRLAGFKSIVESVDKFAKTNEGNSDWIDYIWNGRYLDQSVRNKSATAQKYADDFREICHLLSDLIVFGLTPVIADTFRNFFIEIEKNKNERVENGVMYIYHKIHNDYLHRIISRIFLLYALFNSDRSQDRIQDLFEKLINFLQDGIEAMLQEYKEWILNNNNQEYYDLEEEDEEYIKQISAKDMDTYDYYDKFNRFLLKMESGGSDEQPIYRKLDVLFIKNVVRRFGAEISEIKSFSATRQGYKTPKVAMGSYDRLVKEGNDRHFSTNRLSFVDELSIISDTVSDVAEINRYYSNSQNADLRTTAQRLGDSFGRRFLNLADNGTDSVPYDLSVAFSFINTIAQLFNTKAGKLKWTPSDYKNDISEFKSSLETLFRKSLSIITNNPKIGLIHGNEKINIFGIIADYILARLGVVESVYTPGVVYSFPAPIQVFLKKARDSYLKVLNETEIDLDNPNSSVKLPIYVLFMDEILTKLTSRDFTFWLNIWNGLVSPNTDINQAFPPNVCFIVAGNMPADWRLLEQALLQRSSETTEEPSGDKPVTSYGPSTDTLNALGSRINLYIVTYDYSYLMRTDDSTIKKRTNLFITSLVDGILNNSFSNNSIKLLDTAANIIGGFYDYYKAIVSKRLSIIKEQNNEELARLHAYIASLTARANVTPYDINNLEPNRTIAQLIASNHSTNITNASYKDIVTKATKLNYLFNSTEFGKSIYKHMLLDYFKSNPQEAIYFKRMITLVLSPVVLHMSFLHAYLTWNNMMRNIADELFNMQSNASDTDKSSYYTDIMKVLKNSAVLVNTNIATKNAIEDKLDLNKNTDYALDRIVSLFGQDASKNFVSRLREEKDIRYCHPYVGAFIGLLTIAFYNYIKYMKKFNPRISNSIIDLCSSIENIIREKTEGPNKDTKAISIFNTFMININNYFIDKDYKRKDVIFEKSKKTSDNAVEIKVVAFDKSILDSKQADINDLKMPYKSRGGSVYTDAIAVKIQQTGEGANDIDKDDIEAIKALVKYTFYTYAYKMQKGNINSASLVDYVIGSSNIPTPIVKNLMASFFRSPEDGETFVVEPLREMDRWFTNVSSSVVRYVTIMSVLKHILTYAYELGNKTNLIIDFMKSINGKINKDDFDVLIRDFASLLYKYREAVFTPLAGDKEFRMFSYSYYDASGTTEEYDGYYMNPSNLVNFGDLSFISENLKYKDIIQIESGKEYDYVSAVALEFANNLKEMGTIPTTFLPIHLVSHLDKKQAGLLPKPEIKLLSGTIVRLILGQVGLSGPESDALRFVIEDPDKSPHEYFYTIPEGECDRDICRLMNVLSHNLSIIDTDQLQELKQVTENLLSLNNIIKAQKGKNLITMLEAFSTSHDKIQEIILNLDDGIFSELRKCIRKYSSVGRYVGLWDNKQGEIKDFSAKLLTLLHKRSADNNARKANELITTLDLYIQTAARKIEAMIGKNYGETDKEFVKIKNLLSILQEDSGALNKRILEQIERVIEEVKAQKEGLKREIDLKKSEILQYQLKILNPVIKYSLAILLSNILLAIQGGQLNGYLIDIDKSFAESYKKFNSDGKYEENEYFDILVRYIFYDINRTYTGGANERIVIDTDLVTQYETWVGSTTANGIPLVTPVFTGRYGGKAVVNRDGNNIIGRRVYTKYEYVEEVHGEPKLYCDIHHMPIKGTRNNDGFLDTVGSLMDIASMPGKARISYHDIMFLKDWAEPRYAFAPSSLVNVLLVIGTYLMQNMLLARTTESEFVRRFLPFVITNMYEYYYHEIDAKKDDIEGFLESVINKAYDKPIHPLIPAIALTLNKHDDKIKGALAKSYNIEESEMGTATHSRRDNFMRDLRLRFYSAPLVSDVRYNMYSLYEPGVVIEYGNTTSLEQNEQPAQS
jgi:hypothetical protein